MLYLIDTKGIDFDPEYIKDISEECITLTMNREEARRFTLLQAEHIIETTFNNIGETYYIEEA